MYDLHLHSIYSDGIVTVEEIVKEAKKLNLEGIALTDHDTVAGVKELKILCEDNNINYIFGIEFGITVNKTEVHILGYYIDPDNKILAKAINTAFLNRKSRIRKTIENLNSLLDLNFSEKDLKKYAKDKILGTAHISAYLVDKKICKDIKEAFTKYVGSKGLAYAPKTSLTAKEIINAIKISGGVSVLAHPGDIGDDNIVESIIDDGIDGLEVINSKHNFEQVEKYYSISKRHHLIQTCGSDCHGRIIRNNSKFIGKFNVNYYNVEKIKNLHNLRINK